MEFFKQSYNDCKAKLQNKNVHKLQLKLKAKPWLVVCAAQTNWIKSGRIKQIHTIIDDESTKTAIVSTFVLCRKIKKATNLQTRKKTCLAANHRPEEMTCVWYDLPKLCQPSIVAKLSSRVYLAMLRERSIVNYAPNNRQTNERFCIFSPTQCQ